jgi:hypothetical protein
MARLDHENRFPLPIRRRILWELPLDEVLQYNHCALRAANCWTVSPMPDAANQIARMEAFAASEEED